MKSFEDPRIIFSFNDIIVDMCNSEEYIYFISKDSNIYQIRYHLPLKKKAKPGNFPRSTNNVAEIC